jgi:hypothetical protein
MPTPVTELSTITLSDFTSLVRQKMLGPDMALIQDYTQVSSLYVRDDNPPNQGNTKKYNEVDGQTYATYKPEGADAAKASVIMGYSKTGTKRRFAKEIDITYEMRTENRFPEVTAALTDLSNFCRQRMSIDLTHRLTFATATSYVDMDGQTVDTTVGDGLALVSAVHTLTGTSTTYSNVITGNPVFSPGAFQTARSIANTQIYSQFGDRRIFDFDTVFTSDDPATCDEVKMLLRSTSDPTQNNPGVINPQAGMFRHVILPRLATTATGAYDSTKAKYWGYIATKGSLYNRWQAYFGVWEEPHLLYPAPGNNGDDIHNDNWTYGTRAGYMIVTVGARGFMLSTGLGA